MDEFSRLAVSFIIYSNERVSNFPRFSGASSFLQNNVFIQLLEWLNNESVYRAPQTPIAQISQADSKQILIRELNRHRHTTLYQEHLHLIHLSTELIDTLTERDLQTINMTNLVQHSLVLKGSGPNQDPGLECVQSVSIRNTVHQFVDDEGFLRGIIELIKTIHNGWYEVKDIQASKRPVLGSTNQLKNKRTPRNPVAFIFDMSSDMKDDGLTTQILKEKIQMINFDCETQEGQSKSASIDSSEVTILKGTLGLAHSSRVCTLLTKPPMNARESALFDEIKNHGLLNELAGWRINHAGIRSLFWEDKKYEKKYLLFDFLCRFGWKGPFESVQDLMFYYYPLGKSQTFIQEPEKNLATTLLVLNRIFPCLDQLQSKVFKLKDLSGSTAPKFPPATIFDEQVDVLSDDVKWWGNNTNMCYLLIHRQLMMNMYQGFANLCRQVNPKADLSKLSKIFSCFREAGIDFDKKIKKNCPDQTIKVQDYISRLLVYSLREFINKMLEVHNYERLISTVGSYVTDLKRQSINELGNTTWQELMKTESHPPERCNQNFEMKIADVISIRFLANLPLQSNPSSFDQLLKAAENTFIDLQHRTQDGTIKVSQTIVKDSDKVRGPLFSFYFKPTRTFFSRGLSVLNKDEDEKQYHEDYIRSVAEKIDSMSMSELQDVERQIDYRDRYTRYIFQQFMEQKRANQTANFSQFISAVERLRLD